MYPPPPRILNKINKLIKISNSQFQRNLAHMTRKQKIFWLRSRFISRCWSETRRQELALRKLQTREKKLQTGGPETKKREEKSLLPEMKHPAKMFLLWAFVIAVLLLGCGAEMFTSLQNVKQAISVERKLMENLKTYIDQELERLEDIKRWGRNESRKKFSGRKNISFWVTDGTL